MYILGEIVIRVLSVGSAWLAVVVFVKPFSYEFVRRAARRGGDLRAEHFQNQSEFIGGSDVSSWRARTGSFSPDDFILIRRPSHLYSACLIVAGSV